MSMTIEERGVFLVEIEKEGNKERERVTIK